MSRRLGPEEISELAEALWCACSEHERSHERVSPEIGRWCPFGALLKGWISPTPDTIAKETGIEFDDAHAFTIGFDGLPYYGDREELFSLGRRFRVQALSEGFKPWPPQ